MQIMMEWLILKPLLNSMYDPPKVIHSGCHFPTGLGVDQYKKSELYCEKAFVKLRNTMLRA